MRTLTLTEARRLAVMGQMLGGPRPRSVLEVVERLGRVQVDPTVIVERAERLTMWSRLSSLDREELRRFLEEEPRRLFEYNGYLLAVDDLPLYRPTMRRYPPTVHGRGQYVSEWLRDNAGFRAYVLSELRQRGPLLARELDDRAEVPWQTGGWNDGKNLGRMLEILWRCGEIAIARREGAQRVWDLFARVLPDEGGEELPEEVTTIEMMDRQLRAQGLLPPGFGGAIDVGQLRAREMGLESLLADGVAVPVAVQGARGHWLAHRDGLAELDAGAWQPRTTLLGPFDPLIHDRERALALFGFRFKFELYIPAAKREYGPYTLAVLHGERLVGRLDSAYDRRRRVFTVRSIVEEPDAPAAVRPAVRAAIGQLGAWLGAADGDLPNPTRARGSLPRNPVRHR